MKKIKKTKKKQIALQKTQEFSSTKIEILSTPKPSLIETLFGSLANMLYVLILFSIGSLLLGMFLYLLRVKLTTALYLIFLGVFLIIGVAYLGRRILEEELPPVIPLSKVFLEVLSFILTSIFIIILVFELFLIIAPQRGIGENIIISIVVFGLVLLAFTIYAYTFGRVRFKQGTTKAWLIPIFFVNAMIMIISLFIERGRTPILKEQWVYLFAILYLMTAPYIMWFVGIPSPYSILNEPIERIIEVDRGSSYNMVYFSVGIFLFLILLIFLILQSQKRWYELGFSSFSISSLLFVFISVPNFILYYALYKKYKRAGIIY